MVTRSRIHFNDITGKWEVKGKYGDTALTLGNGTLEGFENAVFTKNAKVASLLTLNSLALGGGTALTYANKSVGTIAISTVGTLTTTVATLIGTHNVAVGNTVLLNRRAAFTDLGISIVGVRVPTLYNIWVDLMNIHADTVASTAGIGVDITILK